MKIAFISDIHGNYEGLITVLKQIGRIDRIICAGDITGYYPFANEVTEKIKKSNILSVRGNHDQYLLDGKAPKSASRKVKESIEFTKKIISKRSLKFLEKLPNRLMFEIKGKKVLVCHGSPWDHLEERIYPDYAHFERFESVDADIIVLGHTHYPLVKKVGRKTIINPGSCGQPRDYNLLSYAIWDTDKNSFEIKRAEWDIAKFKKEAGKKGTDSKLFEVFNRSRE